MSFFRFVLFLIVCLAISCFEKCNGMLKPKSPFCKDDGEFHTEVGSLEMKSISDKDCKDLPLKMVSNGSALLDVNLSAYEYRGRFRSFPLVNISIPYIKFTSMLMRLQIADGTVTKCRNFSIKSNQDTQTHPLTMFWDCRWFNSTYKESLMTVEFLASNKTAFNYKKFSFQLPKYDVQNTDSLHTKLFLYQEEIPGCVKFHVGRSTEILKVSGYRFQLQECIDNCTEAKSEPALETNKSSIEFCESLKFHTLYKVSVEPKICSGNNCSWGTTSFSHEFVTRPAESYTDLYMGLMVTLTVFLIILIVFFSWHVAKIHYSQKISKSNRCILVYEPSSKSHLDVVKELASFLRDMKENVLFGETDIDIGEIGTDWWPRELERADVVLIVSNPIQKHYIDMFKASIHAPVFKGGIVKDSLRCLINDSSRSKRYIRILLPYCQRTDFYDFTRAKPCYHIFEDRQRLFRKIKGIHETCLSRANIWSSYSVFDTDSWRNLEAAIKNYDQGEETINIKSSKYHEDDQYLHSLVQESSSSEDELDISDTEYKVKMLDGVKDNDSSDAESDVLPMHTKNHTTGSQTLSTDISVEISAEDFGEEMKALRNFLPRKM